MACWLSKSLPELRGPEPGELTPKLLVLHHALPSPARRAAGAHLCQKDVVPADIRDGSVGSVVNRLEKRSACVSHARIWSLK